MGILWLKLGWKPRGISRGREKRNPQNSGKPEPSRLLCGLKMGGTSSLYGSNTAKSRLWSPWEPIILYFWATWGYTVAHQPKGLPRNPAVCWVGGRQKLHLELLYPGPRRNWTTGRATGEPGLKYRVDVRWQDSIWHTVPLLLKPVCREPLWGPIKWNKKKCLFLHVQGLCS